MQEINVQKLLSGFEPISLCGLDRVKLLNRVDRKYIIPAGDLPGIIELLSKQYSVLEIDGNRSFTYLTTYYDTAGYRFYKDHHNRLSSRIKVRTRTYQENDLHFFEIKLKSNLRTDKVRKKLAEQSDDLSKGQREQIRSIYPKDLDSSLMPALINSYIRITLVNKARTERCTIDVNLAFKDPEKPDHEISVSDIAIIEVKQSRASILKGIIASLRKQRIYPSSISKYVLGLILTRPEIKYNSFKPLLLKIDKIKKQNNSYII